MQYEMKTALLGDRRKHIGAFGAVMNVENISPIELLNHGPKDVLINRFLYYPGCSIYRRMHPVTEIPVRQTNEPVGRVAPGIIERLTNDSLFSISKHIRYPPGNGPAPEFGKGF
jgi:hypothetical protein